LNARDIAEKIAKLKKTFPELSNASGKAVEQADEVNKYPRQLTGIILIFKTKQKTSGQQQWG